MKIGVVGSGVSGLVSAWLLARQHEVSVFEADDRIGGHVHTVRCEDSSGPANVDTGFIVFNDAYYPIFTKILGMLNVPSKPTTMSLSVQDVRNDFEYSGANLFSLFAQPQNLFKNSHYRFLGEILRFISQIEELASLDPTNTVLEYCRQQDFSEDFLNYFLSPLGSSLWSTPVSEFKNFPICFVASFLKNHGMDRWIGRPKWRVIENGSQSYLRKLVKEIEGTIYDGTRIESIERQETGLRLRTKDREYLFDEVVIACHANTALKLLASPTHTEKEILGAFGYQTNETVLHTDVRLLPKSRNAWACWNFKTGDPIQAPQVTYNMNKLQGLKSRETYCVTLNRTDEIEPARVIRRINYSHPVSSHRSVTASKQRQKLIRHEGLSYCGAYWGYGFHEDGVRSAVEVASRFGIEL